MKLRLATLVFLKPPQPQGGFAFGFASVGCAVVDVKGASI
jgi:hypothetical protein